MAMKTIFFYIRSVLGLSIICIKSRAKKKEMNLTHVLVARREHTSNANVIINWFMQNGKKLDKRTLFFLLFL